MKRVFVMAVALLLASAARAEDVMVFAAASTTNALNEIGEGFAAKTGHRMVASYAASSVLAKQIEQGAPAAVFLSADRKWMDYLADRKLVTGRVNLLGNALVLIAPADSTLATVELKSLGGLLGNGRLATGDPDHVPVGLYAKQALETLGQWAAVAPRLARAESVRAGMALVERGEVPLGIVYATDAAVSQKVKVVATFPGTSHEPIVYPVALVAGRDGAAAWAFLDHLHSAAAKGIFARHGFKLN
jgi:molybdate transport system substrate-binding protein